MSSSASPFSVANGNTTRLPLLRWAGSKRKLLPQLLQAAPLEFSRYVEPFAGSACLFFALRPARALLSDMNVDLIDTYRTLAWRPGEVARAVHAIPNTKSRYYQVRKTNPQELSAIERAARFVYLNRHCFNGVYRVNRRGDFNVPRGTKTGVVPDLAHFVECGRALRNATLVAADYRIALSKVKEFDFVYLDPPYASRRRNTHGEYGYGAFSEENLPDLWSVLTEIADKKATFVLSYSDHKKFRRLPRGWFSKRIRVRRHVAGFVGHRGEVTELLISNAKQAFRCG